MTPDQEEEYLIHIAAGTDPLTALAALPTDEEQKPQGPPHQRTKNCGCLVVVLILMAVLCLAIH